MESLFPNRPAQTHTSDRVPLVSFNAGKCVMSTPQSNGKILVTSDEKKGKIMLERAADGRLFFVWRNRTTNRTEDSVLLSHGAAAFKKVQTGREGDRVYLLKVNNVVRSMYWMQEKANDNDLPNCKKLNDFINDPAAAAAAFNAANPAGPGPSDAFMQMLGLPPMAARQAAPPAAPPAPVAAPQNSLIGGLDLSSLLSQIPSQPLAPATATQAPNTSANSQASGTTEDPQESLRRALMNVTGQTQRLSLEDVITADGVLRSGVLDDPEVRAALIRHLPEGQQNEEDLIDTLRSPQFQQALRALGSALQTDNFNSIMANLSIDPTPGTSSMLRGDSVRALLESLVAQFSSTPTEPNEQNDHHMDESH